MRVRHHARDAGQHRVGGRFRRPYLQRALAVDGAREYLITRLLRDRHALARDRRLIDRSRPLYDRSVETDPVAAAHDEARADGDVRRANIRLGPVVAHDAHGLGREIEQGRDGVPGASHAPAFQKQRQGEQEGDRGALEQLPDRHRSDDGDDHEQVHVGHQRASREPSLGSDEAHAKRDGRKIEKARDPLDRVAAASVHDVHRCDDLARAEELRQQASDEEGAAQGGEPLLRPKPRARVRAVPRARAPGRHAGRVDGGDHVRVGDRFGLVEDRHAAVQDVECQAVRPANQRADDPLEDRHFLRAIEPGHVERASDPLGRRRNGNLPFGVLAA